VQGELTEPQKHVHEDVVRSVPMSSFPPRLRTRHGRSHCAGGEGLLRAGSFGLGAWEGIPETAWLVL